MKNLIGIYSPFPQSGKSTVFSFLNELVGYERLPFASPLKEIGTYLLQITGVPDSEAQRYIYEDKEEQIPGFPEGITARFLLQRLGTDFGRNTIDPDIWIKAWVNTVNGLPEQVPNIVVDDVRFENEVRTVRELGGKLWKVVRPSLNPTGSESHSSEQGLEHEEFDVVIVNDGSIDDLREKVIEALETSPG
jgi:hypothetical protein